ncbi:hypothetical protein [Haloferula sp.]|uniref:hypothetical protein n=1 Tax=Haloferula sp. TaxID=2497595 RepID=UPI00329AE937
MKNFNPRVFGRTKATAITLLCGFALPSLTHAATVTVGSGGNTTSNWDNNWTNASVPSANLPNNVLPAASASDTAIINQNRTVQVDSAIDIVAGRVIVANTNGGAFNDTSLEINTGGTLNTGELILSANDDAGTLEVQGGTLTSSSLDTRANGTANVSSGILNSGNVRARSGTTTSGAVNVSGTGTVNATGTTTVDSGTMNGSLNVSGGSYNGAAFAVSGNVNVSGTGAVTATGDTTVSNGGTYEVSGGTVNTASNKVIVETGGNFNVSGGDVTTQSTSGTAGAALQLNGGDITVSSGTLTVNEFSAGGGTTHVTNGTGTLHVTGGNFIFAGATSASDTIGFSNDTINISGGTFSATGGQILTTGNPEFNIDGSGAIIQMDRLNLSAASRATTFNFIMDAAGVSSVDQGSSSYADLAFVTLNIDGSEYAGSTGIIDLFNYTNIVSTAAAVNVTGLGVEGVDYNFEESTTENYVRLNIINVVPEPSSALFALTGMAGLLLRRRR